MLTWFLHSYLQSTMDSVIGQTLQLITSLIAHNFLGSILFLLGVKNNSCVYGFCLSLEKIGESKIFIDIQDKRTCHVSSVSIRNSVLKEILNIIKFSEIKSLVPASFCH
jgi:hypothetical protein